ncbi:hypothetical protein CC80DRAFT_63539 [Byssothecium circinans]|uniref:Myb-like domain-containing protein n=1 Tax=Byssothecium circinans TaxID=147558 RepID=A0A6A5TVK9_9PLEO|nr:hypothetical protein CC80DRAFT_63539 [Byssothecium circinans]
MLIRMETKNVTIHKKSPLHKTKGAGLKKTAQKKDSTASKKLHGRPRLRRFTAEEDETLLRMWFDMKDFKDIAKAMPGRSWSALRLRKYELAGDGNWCKTGPLPVYTKLVKEYMVSPSELDKPI